MQLVNREELRLRMCLMLTIKENIKATKLCLQLYLVLFGVKRLILISFDVFYN